jgi:hypothetical protein
MRPVVIRAPHPPDPHAMTSSGTLNALRNAAFAAQCVVGLSPTPAAASSLPATTAGMTVLEFTRTCRLNEKACWVLMDQTMDRLRASDNGTSFCLPRSLTLFSAQVVYPVALLDTWAQMAMAERFGRAEQPFDDILVEKVGAMYPCRSAQK